MPSSLQDTGFEVRQRHKGCETLDCDPFSQVIPVRSIFSPLALTATVEARREAHEAGRRPLERRADEPGATADWRTETSSRDSWGAARGALAVDARAPLQAARAARADAVLMVVAAILRSVLSNHKDGDQNPRFTVDFNVHLVSISEMPARRLVIGAFRYDQDARRTDIPTPQPYDEGNRYPFTKLPTATCQVDISSVSAVRLLIPFYRSEWYRVWIPRSSRNDGGVSRPKTLLPSPASRRQRAERPPGRPAAKGASAVEPAGDQRARASRSEWGHPCIGGQQLSAHGGVRNLRGC